MKRSLLSQTLSALAFLGTRQVLVQGLGAVTGLLLAKLLSPELFGVYGLAAFCFYGFLVIGDLGLGAALVQRTEDPGVNDMRLIFTVRLLLDCGVSVAVWFGAAFLSGLYELGWEGVWFFRAMALASMLQSLQIVPIMVMERQMRFREVAYVEVLQAFVLTFVLLLAAVLETGILGFAAAWIAFSAAGAITASFFQRWPIGFFLSRTELQAALSFGLPFHATTVLQVVRDGAGPVLLGTLLGTAALGRVNFAQMLALFAVHAMVVLPRVCLPSFSQVKERPDELKRIVQAVLRLSHVLTAPLAVMLLINAENIVYLVFGQKWNEAIPLFYPIWLANLCAPTNLVLLSVLHGLGRAKTAFWFSLFVALATWVIALPMIHFWGSYGFAITLGLVQSSSFILVHMLGHYVQMSVWRAMRTPWLIALIFGGAAWFLQTHWPPHSILQLISYMSSYLLLYLATYAAVCGGAVLRRVRGKRCGLRLSFEALP